MEQATSAKRRLADTLLRGGLDGFVAARRASNQSWRQISMALQQQIDLDIHPETLRLWFTETAAA